MNWASIASILYEKYCYKERVAEKYVVRCNICGQVLFDGVPDSGSQIQSAVYRLFEFFHEEVFELAKKEAEERLRSRNGKKEKRENMVLISVHVPKSMLDELDRLVQEGRFPNRSEAIRVAIRDLLIRERSMKERKNEVDVPLVPGR